MTRRLVGAVASCLALLTGLWLILAPFALGIQPEDVDWKDETFTDVWSGIGLAVVGLIGVIIFAAALIQHLAERGLLQPRPARTDAAPAAVSPAESATQAGANHSADLDQLLSPLVAALARDLERTPEANGASVPSTNSDTPTASGHPTEATR